MITLFTNIGYTLKKFSYIYAHPMPTENMHVGYRKGLINKGSL